MTIPDDYAQIGGQPIHVVGLPTKDFALSTSPAAGSAVSITGSVSVAQSVAAIDAFGRFRVSNSFTIFDSKSITDDDLYFDDAEITGSATSSVYNQNLAAYTLSVSGTSFGTRVRQTYQRFNYQPGKSQLIFLTGILGSGISGITRRIGYFDDHNGIFVQLAGETLSFAIRNNTSGIPSDNVVAQADWNIDKLDGTGESGITLDVSKTQIIVIDFEWLGVGTVRVGFVINGMIYYVHRFNHANINTTVYMSTPNLPIRYEINNDGTGSAASLVAICSSVISEGGQETLGEAHYVSTGGTHVDANVANTVYAVVGIRLKAAHVGATILIEGISMLSETNDDFEFLWILNPTIADGGLSYSDLDNSCIQFGLGATAKTVTNGIPLFGGFSNRQSGVSRTPPNGRKLGVALDGTLDQMVLCVRPLSANADIQGGIAIRQL